MRVLVVMAVVVGCGGGGDGGEGTAEAATSSAQKAALSAAAAPSSAAPPANTAAPEAERRAALQAAADFLKALAPRRKELGAVDLKRLDEETDPNKLLGRPGQYVAKLTWRIEGLGQAVDDEATIELYPDVKGAQARAEYIRKIGEASPMFLQYVYVNEKRAAVLRVPKVLTPAKAKVWEELLLSL